MSRELTGVKLVAREYGDEFDTMVRNFDSSLSSVSVKATPSLIGTI